MNLKEIIAESRWPGQPRTPVPDLDTLTPSDLSYEMPFDEFDREKLKRIIAKYMDRFPKKTQYVLRRMFWDRWDTLDIRKDLNITADRVRRIQIDAFKLLRKWFEEDKFDPYDYSDFKADESRGHDIIKQKLQDIESRKNSPEDNEDEYQKHIERMKQQKREYLKKNPNSIYKPDPETNEDKDPCWKGYKQIGTKKKSGKTVPNCVPVSEDIETKMSSLIKLLESK